MLVFKLFSGSRIFYISFLLISLFFCIYHLILKLRETNHKPFNSQDLINNALYCLPYNFCDVSLENLVLDQLIIPLLIFFYILITCLLDIELILEGEILSWSLMGVKGLNWFWLWNCKSKLYFNHNVHIITLYSLYHRDLCFVYFLVLDFTELMGYFSTEIQIWGFFSRIDGSLNT